MPISNIIWYILGILVLIMLIYPEAIAGKESFESDICSPKLDIHSASVLLENSRHRRYLSQNFHIPGTICVADSNSPINIQGKRRQPIYPHNAVHGCITKGFD